jgi:subtilisin family serine protease
MADEKALVEVHFVEESGKDSAKECLENLDASDIHVYDGFAEGVIDRREVGSLKEETKARGLILNVATPLSPQVELAATSDQMEQLFPGSTIQNDRVRECVAKFQGLAKKVDVAAPAAPGARPGVRARSAGPASAGASILGAAAPKAYRILNTARAVAKPMLDGIQIEGLTGAKVQNNPSPKVMLPKDAYLVRLRAGLRPDWARQLHAAGGETKTQRGPFTYIMQLTPDQWKAIEAMPFVLSTKRYGLVDTLSEDFQKALVKLDDRKKKVTARGAPAAPAAQDQPEVPDTFDILLHSESDLEDMAASIQASPKVQVVEKARDQIRVKSAIDNPVLAALVNDPRVMKITPYAAPKMLCDNVRARIGSGLVATAGGMKWDGTGQVVTIIDSGIDDAHEDLSTQLAVPPMQFRSGTAMDTEGHGTHVAGIIAGTGKASGGQFAGVAPGAKLITIGVRDANKKLDLPLDLGDLFRIGYEKDARIFNLSLGINTVSSSYESGAHSLDRFVWEHPDALIVVAAGNSGAARDNAGKHQWRSIHSPGNAKNAVTVGSANSERKPEPPQTWGECCGASFPDPPAADEPVSGDISVPAGNSSRGPTDYQSIKPDVLAPGTMIVSTRSSQCSKPAFNGSNSYTVLSGTSMAAPAVTGAAAILRQFLQAELGIAKPSAALLKALLIASAEPLDYSNPLRSAFEPNVGFPDFHQGFGCIDLRRILPNPDRPAGCKVTFVDVPAESAQALSSTQLGAGGAVPNAVARFRFSSGATVVPLRVVLTWTDPPGKGVQHNLNLTLQAGTLTRAGNDSHKFASFADQPSFDFFNSVEIVREPAPPPNAKFAMKIEAQSSFDGSQGYALVVVGPIDKGLKESWSSALPLKAEAATF